MKTFNYNNQQFGFYTATYQMNGNTFVGLQVYENGESEPYSDVAVNLDLKLNKDLAFIDINGLDENIIAFLCKNGFISYTGHDYPSVFLMYPLCKLNIEKINKYGGNL